MWTMQNVERAMAERRLTAFVTGGASGIGLATAKELLRRHWNVAIADRDPHAIAAAGDAALHHDQPGFGPAQQCVSGDRAEALPQRGEARGGCLGQNGKPPLSTRWREGIGG